MEFTFYRCRHKECSLAQYCYRHIADAEHCDDKEIEYKEFDPDLTKKQCSGFIFDSRNKDAIRAFMYKA